MRTSQSSGLVTTSHFYSVLLQGRFVRASALWARQKFLCSIASRAKLRIMRVSFSGPKVMLRSGFLGVSLIGISLWGQLKEETARRGVWFRIPCSDLILVSMMWRMFLLPVQTEQAEAQSQVELASECFFAATVEGCLRDYARAEESYAYENWPLGVLICKVHTYCIARRKKSSKPHFSVWNILQVVRLTRFNGTTTQIVVCKRNFLRLRVFDGQYQPLLGKRAYRAKRQYKTI